MYIACRLGGKEGEFIKRKLPIVENSLRNHYARGALFIRVRFNHAPLLTFTPPNNSDLFDFPPSPSPSSLPLSLSPPSHRHFETRRGNNVRSSKADDEGIDRLRNRYASIRCVSSRAGDAIDGSVFRRAYEAAWDSRSKWNLPHLGGEACSILDGAHTCSPSFPFDSPGRLRHRDLLHRGPQTSLALRQVHISLSPPHSRTRKFT